MKKKSHRILGIYLTKYIQRFPARRYEKAFQFGCIEPDINIITYMRGSLRIEPFRGHNYKNAERYILRAAANLQRVHRWGILAYYRLGKLIHYISDAFTYPHNGHCSISDHMDYENRLHGCLADSIAAFPGAPAGSAGISAVKYILLAHHQYSEKSGEALTDVQYILNTTRMILRMLLPEEEEYFGQPLHALLYDAVYSNEPA